MKSPMKTCLEHPLLWAFLNMKLVQVEMILTCDDKIAQVKRVYYITILCHLMYSVTIIYSVLYLEILCCGKCSVVYLLNDGLTCCSESAISFSFKYC